MEDIIKSLKEQRDRIEKAIAILSGGNDKKEVARFIDEMKKITPYSRIVHKDDVFFNDYTQAIPHSKPNRRLTLSERKQIRRAVKKGIKRKELAVLYGVTTSTIHNIINKPLK